MPFELNKTWGGSPTQTRDPLQAEPLISRRCTQTRCRPCEVRRDRRVATPGRGGGEGLEADEFVGKKSSILMASFRGFWPFRGFLLRVFLGKCHPYC